MVAILSGNARYERTFHEKIVSHSYARVTEMTHNRKSNLENKAVAWIREAGKPYKSEFKCSTTGF